MKMARENKTNVLTAVNVEIETLGSKLEDNLEEVKDVRKKVQELVAIVKESGIKVFGEDMHEQKDTSKKHSNVNDKENDVMTLTKEHYTLLNCKIFKAQVKLRFTSAFNKWKFLFIFLSFYLGHSKSGSK